MNDQEIYERCVKRLINNRVYDPYAAIVHLEKEIDYYRERIVRLQEDLNGSNTQALEPLTDTEQRIFYAAMRREKEICKRVDLEYGPEFGGINLVNVCSEITRKVTGKLL